MRATTNTAAPSATPPTTLSGDLPLFCEGCGYSLVNLPQVRCGECAILHYHCPECGHRQPLNTLRPALHRMLGRLRFGYLAFSVFFRLNYFGWGLFIWFMVTFDVTRYFDDVSPPFREFDFLSDTALGFVLWTFVFACVGRMFLLRWRRGYRVGLGLAGVQLVAMVLGTMYQRSLNVNWYTHGPLRPGYYVLLGCVAAVAVAGASAGWPLWVGLVRVFLPQRTAAPLLAWQRGLSNPRATIYEPTVFRPTPPIE